MPTAFITTWDSYTNAVQQHYLPIDFKSWTPPAGKPVILHAYTAGVVHESVANAEMFLPEGWKQDQVHKVDDEVMVIVMKKTNDHGGFIIKTYCVRWHY